MFNKNEFIQLLLDYGVLKFGEFTLKSGRVSPYFFNAGLLSSGKALDMLSKGYAQILANELKNTENPINRNIPKRDNLIFRLRIAPDKKKADN